MIPHPILRKAIYMVLLVGFLAAGYASYVLARFFLEFSTIEAQVEDFRVWLYGDTQENRRKTIRIYSRDGVLIGELLPERGSHITMNACGEMTWLNRAAVSSEDRWFYDHHGISLRGVLRAMWNNLRSFSIREGAGSITMQLARNLFTDRSDSLYRKLYETYTAFLLESRLTKEEILCLYLNKIYMGEGRVGAEEASWYYFRKPPVRLDAAEAAMIVGLFPSPVRYSPQNNILLSLKKQQLVFDAMVRDGWMTDEDVQKVEKSFIQNYGIRQEGENPHAGTIGAYGASRDFRLHHPAPAVNEAVRQFLYETLPEKTILKGDLKVTTTVDSRRQAAAIQAVRNVVGKLREKDPDQEIRDRLNGVMMIVDPFLGETLAMVGGYRVSEGGSMTSRLYRMRRQPGSVIKGILYADALNYRVLYPEEEVVDEPIRIGRYEPANWYPGYLGTIPLRLAVAKSVNTVAVRTIQSLGVDRFRRDLALGLSLDYREARKRFPDSPTLALGSGELSVVEVASLYAMLLNGGWSVEPLILSRVEDGNGKILWKSPPPFSKSVRVLSQQSTGEALYLLRGVLDDEEGTAHWIGRAVRKMEDQEDLDMAAKTGTVQSVPEVLKKFPGRTGAHDAWFAGLLPDEATVIWVGQDDGAPFQGSGGLTAGSIWFEYLRQILPGTSHGHFPEAYVPEEE